MGMRARIGFLFARVCVRLDIYMNIHILIRMHTFVFLGFNRIFDKETIVIPVNSFYG